MEETDDDRLSLLSGGSSPLASKTKRSWKRRKMIVYEDEDEEEEEANQVQSSLNIDDDEEVGVEVKPIGNVVRVSGEGESRRNHFRGFQADGVSYELEDTVLVSPEEHSINMKPLVVMIKDINATTDGRISLIGRCLYRPENVGREKWKSRELFYSFDEIKFPSESVMHKCRVHFIPPNMNIPNPEQHPGFIVQNIYNVKSNRLYAILDDDADYKDDNMHMELFALVQKTIDQIPNSPLALI